MPRRGNTPQQAYEIASERLADQGFSAVRLISFSIDRDKRTNLETFLLRIEVEPGPTASSS